MEGSEKTPGAGRLPQTLEELLKKIDKLLSTPQALQAKDKLNQFGDEVNRLVNSPRGKEITAKIDASMSRLGTQVDAAMQSPKSVEARQKVKQALDDVAEHAKMAYESPESQRAREDMARFLRDLGDKISPPPKQQQP